MAFWLAVGCKTALSLRGLKLGISCQVRAFYKRSEKQGVSRVANLRGRKR
ncbi:hypothetical protein C4K18_4783 [Pseudomonas chlororaphis subsp. aurantiaca]|nr:hypothetical protein C4K18_4783 [Pseudomonas chlororaphis subsp. aurantiaca]